MAANINRNRPATDIDLLSRTLLRQTQKHRTLPAHLRARAGRNKPFVRVTNTRTGVTVEVPIFAWRDVQFALSELV